MNPSPLSDALRRGFEAMGWRVQMRSAHHYRDGQVEDFDAIATDGIRGQRKAALRDYAHVPNLVAEFGYLKRASEDGGDYWSLGIGGLNWLPAGACPADRWNRLGLTVKRKHEGVTLIAGQKIGDESHPFDTAEKLEQWAQGVAEETDRPVAFRPHPRSKNVAPKGLRIDRLPLDESLAQTGTVIAYSSNIGNDALLAGCNVKAEGPAIWAGVTLQTRREYFHRLAYAQWTLGEMASGEAIQFILRAWHDR